MIVKIPPFCSKCHASWRLVQNGTRIGVSCSRLKCDMVILREFDDEYQVLKNLAALKTEEKKVKA